jgi:hypothetical protein
MKQQQVIIVNNSEDLFRLLADTYEFSSYYLDKLATTHPDDRRRQEIALKTRNLKNALQSAIFDTRDCINQYYRDFKWELDDDGNNITSYWPVAGYQDE